MSRIYVHDECPMCKKPLKSGELGFIVQQVTFTDVNLETLNRRKLKPHEMRVIRTPGTLFAIHPQCLDFLKYRP